MYLNLLIDFNLKYLPNPYQKRTKSYIVNIAYKIKDKKVQLINKADKKSKKPKG